MRTTNTQFSGLFIASVILIILALAPVASASGNAASAAPEEYVVRAGDTLFGIALKFGVELTDLLRWNKLSGKSVLQPGLRLRISSQ